MTIRKTKKTYTYLKDFLKEEDKKVTKTELLIKEKDNNNKGLHIIRFITVLLYSIIIVPVVLLMLNPLFSFIGDASEITMEDYNFLIKNYEEGNFKKSDLGKMTMLYAEELSYIPYVNYLMFLDKIDTDKLNYIPKYIQEIREKKNLKLMKIRFYFQDMIPISVGIRKSIQAFYKKDYFKSITKEERKKVSEFYLKFTIKINSYEIPYYSYSYILSDLHAGIINKDKVNKYFDDNFITNLEYRNMQGKDGLTFTTYLPKNEEIELREKYKKAIKEFLKQ